MSKIVHVAPRATIITDLLKNHKGRFVTLINIKKDGTERTFNGRFDVVKGTKGIGLNHDPAVHGQVVIAEVLPGRDRKGRYTKLNHCQFRKVDLNTLQVAIFNGKTMLAKERTIDYKYL